MIIKQKVSSLLYIAVLLVLSFFVSSVYTEETKEIIDECDMCHGKNGVSLNDHFPTIAGFSAFYLDDNLRIYRDAARPCENYAYPEGEKKGTKATMCELTKDLSNEQIGMLADHYAQQKFVAAKQAYDAQKAELGKKVHEAYCEKCHAKGGSDGADDSGILAGQWMHYLEETFEQYDAGTREQPRKMKIIWQKLEADHKEALLHYYASQQ